MMNLVPKIRNFIDDPKNPGNLNYLWFKDMPRIRQFIWNKGHREQPHKFTTWKSSAQHGSVILYVPATSWSPSSGAVSPDIIVACHHVHSRFST
ncbi:MAG: hypothetical protein VB016_00875 [Methanomassiliicoccaceae archaeon]|nr:hypothetical protein [Methanomassiliicoccaceae archaeon]